MYRCTARGCAIREKEFSVKFETALLNGLRKVHGKGYAGWLVSGSGCDEGAVGTEYEVNVLLPERSRLNWWRGWQDLMCHGWQVREEGCGLRYSTVKSLERIVRDWYAGVKPRNSFGSGLRSMTRTCWIATEEDMVVENRECVDVVECEDYERFDQTNMDIVEAKDRQREDLSAMVRRKWTAGEMEETLRTAVREAMVYSRWSVVKRAEKYGSA